MSPFSVRWRTHYTIGLGFEAGCIVVERLRELIYMSLERFRIHESLYP